MLLIGEVSKISQVSLRMLRYYDMNDIFKPKVINQENGYRYYTADQLDDLYKIVELRDLGFSVAQIKDLITEHEEDKYLLAVEQKQQELQEQLIKTQAQLKRLEAMKADLHRKDAALHKDISIVLKKIPDYDVLSYRKTVADYFCEGQMWEELVKLTAPLKVGPFTESFSLYHDLDYREEDVDIELCLVITKQIQTIPEGLIHRQVPGCEQAVSIIVKGPFSNISAAYREFAYWLENHPEYRMSGPNRQICHVTPYDTDNEEEYVTELLIPLTLTK